MGAQLGAYAAASHGWFFWTYKDQAEHWDLGTCFERKWLLPGLQCDKHCGVKAMVSAPTLPRLEAPGPFPACYGEEWFSRLPKRSKHAASEDALKEAQLMAEAAGRSANEALECLAFFRGNNEKAMARLLLLNAADE